MTPLGAGSDAGADHQSLPPGNPCSFGGDQHMSNKMSPWRYLAKVTLISNPRRLARKHLVRWRNQNPKTASFTDANGSITKGLCNQITHWFIHSHIRVM
jgi:hypothetical protein